MAARRKEHIDIWTSFLKLANNDDRLVRAAALRATDSEGRVCLQTVKRHILNTSNPALLATIEAADEFVRVAQCDDKFIDLPHLHRVYEMAERDLNLPRKVFNAAAQFIQNGATVDCAIHTAIMQHHQRLSLH
jgi:hypothetical protein